MRQLLEIDLSDSLVVNSKTFLRTKETKQIYAKVMGLLKSFVNLSESKKFIESRFVPGLNKSDILSNFDIFRTSIDFMKAYPIEYLDCFNDLKIGLDLLDFKLKESIVLAFDDEEVYFKFKKNYSDYKLNFVLLTSLNDIEDLKEFDSIRFIKTCDSRISSILDCMDNCAVHLKDSDIFVIVPELLFLNFINHRTIFEKYFSILNNFNLSDSFLKYNSIYSRITRDGEIKKISLLDKSLLESLIDVKFKSLESEFSNIIANYSFTGRDFLSLINNSELSLNDFPDDLKSLLNDKLDSFFNSIISEFNITDSLMINSIRGILNNTYPLSLNDVGLNILYDRVNKLNSDNKYNTLKEIILDLSSFMSDLELMKSMVIKLDIMQSLYKFSVKFNLSEPCLIDGCSKVEFYNGVNLFLKSSDLSNVTPIDYNLGVINNQVLLTGANSGGKTTLLNLISQIVIMSNSGMFVPSNNCEVSVFDSFYYFSKNRGSASAGAFETLLQKFASIDSSNNNKLILADEIEAVTEPGAASKLINRILDWFSKYDHTLVCIVTHLGLALKKQVSNCVRIDGIDAVGLDENNKIIIDRQPKFNYLARSTPELILQKLSQTKSKYVSFYKHLVEVV